MSNLRKEINVDGKTHHISIDSSLDLNDVEITGTDPITGKVVHISLSSLLKNPQRPEPIMQQQEEVRQEPLGLFEKKSDLGGMESEDNSDTLKNMFGD